MRYEYPRVVISSGPLDEIGAGVGDEVEIIGGRGVLELRRAALLPTESRAAPTPQERLLSVRRMRQER